MNQLVKYQLIISENAHFVPDNLFNFQRYFFNEIEHLKHQGGDDLYTFYWQEVNFKTIEARFSVIIKDKIAYSPFKATFGGIEFSQSLSEISLHQFLERVESFLFSKNISEIHINLYPEKYLSEQQKHILENCLQKLHFQIKYTEHNYEIDVTEKSFLEIIISPRAKQLLKKSIKNEFVIKNETNPDFSIIHAFIANSRLRKNRPMTMTLEQLTEHFQKFPDNFQLFSVYDIDVLIATGVTIKINQDILYTFYLADNEQYLKHSPTIYLLSGIYEYGQKENFKLLDLGIATDKGVLNEGLARFKRSLGGKLSEKKTYFRKY
ncbi:hypothetical protein VB796_07130 [Arcicella sp. LKC2W]|uniref:hypothetical protein n=1 Tax=Arcicella sp. LKC2W TaxID=2984198 RepID=UPI002B2145C8|nr:hypothetical protein [Arcicella sp. LKC2W]MEA5458802.1 hypothetical protein [Arcicella sp. LKC2W]